MIATTGGVVTLSPARLCKGWTLTSLSPLPADPEPGSEPELSRVTVVVGDLQLDVGLPDDVSIGAVADDVVELAAAQSSVQAEQPDIELNGTKGDWTLGLLGAEPFDPRRSLGELNVRDGEVLLLRKVGTPCTPMLFDDLEVDGAVSQRRWRDELERDAPMIGCFAVGVIVSVTAALLLARRSSATPTVAAAVCVGGVSAIAACTLRYSAAARASPWLVLVAMPLIFAGSLHFVPGGIGVSSLPIGFGVSGFVALVALLTSGQGRSFYTALIAVAVFGTAASVAVVMWSPAPRSIGAILATASMIMVYLAPRLTIAVSKLPVPPVPTAGEPLDDIETEGGTAVEGVNAVGKQVIPTEEGLIDRVRPSNQYLRGIVVAATVTAMIGSDLAIDVSNGFFWQGTAFAVTVATVLCLRGRSHYDLVQSATLIGGGLLTGFGLLVKTATYLDDWRVNAALAVVVLMGVMVACGLVAPQLEFSPVMKRQVELLEFVAIATLFPLCFWILRLYAFFRELRI
jgi:type VII secretion integral membrane protein EccD